MKKVLSIFLILLILIQSGISIVPIFASSGVAKLSVQDINAEAGETIQLTVSLDSNPGLTFLKIRLSYDTNVLTLFGAYNGNVIKDMTSGKAYVWSTANTSYATGTLATFIFTVKPGTKQGSYPITFTCSEASNGEYDVSVPTVTGTIKVNCVHNMKETSHTEATCKVTGKSVMKCTECSYTETITFDKVDCSPVNEATCEDASVCEYCGETLEKALGHAYRSETVEPTTSSEGYTLHTCMRCGDEYVDDVVPPIIEHEHTFVRQQVVKPTCTKEGYTLYQCSDSNCGETKKENIVSASGHKYTSKVTAPTCTAQGYTTHTCSCGDSYKDTVTSALGHNYAGGSCTRCGAEDPNAQPPHEDCDVIFTLGDISGKPGETIRIALTVKSLVNINSIALYSLNYDSNVLTFVGFENYEAIADKAVLSGFDKENGTITIALSPAEAYSGKICDLVFTINENAAEGTVATVKASSIVKLNSTNITAFVESAEVVVRTQLLGDIDGNETVDINDALLLFQHSMLPTVYPVDYIGNLDFNKDGFLDINDALRLFQYSMLPDIYPIA